MDIAPLTTPHTGYQSRDGKVCLCCEDGGKVAVLDPDIDQVVETFAIPSTNSHRRTISPLGDWLYTENGENQTVSAVDLRRAARALTLSHPLSGITHLPTDLLWYFLRLIRNSFSCSIPSVGIGFPILT